MPIVSTNGDGRLDPVANAKANIKHTNCFILQAVTKTTGGSIVEYLNFYTFKIKNQCHPN